MAVFDGRRRARGRGNYTVPDDPAKPMSLADLLDHYCGFVAAKL